MKNSEILNIIKMEAMEALLDAAASENCNIASTKEALYTISNIAWRIAVKTNDPYFKCESKRIENLINLLKKH